MIYYGKLFQLMKKQGKNTTHIREQKIIGQETLRKLRIGTGIIETYDYRVPGTTPVQIEKRTRETSIDTKSIESLCVWLNCQASDIMEIIPNTKENAKRLSEILRCTEEELPLRVPMQEN